MEGELELVFQTLCSRVKLSEEYVKEAIKEFDQVYNNHFNMNFE